MQSIKTDQQQELRRGDFDTLLQALEHAARGKSGLNFYNSTGTLEQTISYSDLHSKALRVSQQLLAYNLKPNDRVSIIASMTPDFVIAFFACQYAGLIPVPLPLTTSAHNTAFYMERIARLLVSSGSRIALAAKSSVKYLHEANQQATANGIATNLAYVGTLDNLGEANPGPMRLYPRKKDDVAYIQYTSGSTKFPRGVMLTSGAVTHNIANFLNHGVNASPGDEIFSWLPFYHDMGLVGALLGTISMQASGSFLDSRAFSIRPYLWIKLMHITKAAVSFSPSFGYKLCTTNWSKKYNPMDFDLSNWRVAGVGAELIQPEILAEFAHKFKDSGFNSKAFTPCYGMAECSLAVSFSTLGEGIVTDFISKKSLTEEPPIAVPVDKNAADACQFVLCGQPLPESEVQIRNRNDTRKCLPERSIGLIFARSPSLMNGYLNAPDISRQVLSEDRWLNTGDLGYMIDNNVVIVGRTKDFVVINGRNVWFRDFEDIAESHPDVKPDSSLAFSITGKNGQEIPVIYIKQQQNINANKDLFITELKNDIISKLGTKCHIELVKHNAIPYTSSGKVSRVQARINFMKALEEESITLSL